VLGNRYSSILIVIRRRPRRHPAGIEEVVMDKGYHSGAVLMDLAKREIRSYVPEPERGKRHWFDKAEEQRCVYANRRRVVRSGRSDFRNCAESYASGASRTAMKPERCGACMYAAPIMH